MRIVMLFAIAALMCPAPAMAWNDTGHRLIASIAFRRLTPAQRAVFADILREHPRFQQDFVEQMPRQLAAGPCEAQDEWLLQQAAVWPDIVRGLPEPEQDVYNHATWHYITNPTFLSDADRDALQAGLEINNSVEAPETTQERMNAVQAILRSQRAVADSATKPAERAVMLCWLLHVVGDVHQPLHSTSMYSRVLFPTGDRGGNSVPVAQDRNLHTIWDDFPGPLTEYQVIHDRADVVMNDADSAAIGLDAIATLAPADWIKESHGLATTEVYTPEVIGPLRIVESSAGGELAPLTLSDGYWKNGAAVCNHRVVQAGFRLGAVLQAIDIRQGE